VDAKAQSGNSPCIANSGLDIGCGICYSLTNELAAVDSPLHMITRRIDIVRSGADQGSASQL